ncbi:hypothetical protein CA850_30200 [Micromonospora echinospora]|nr:hypothetical protein [Micromonospora echinospora]OZV74289.1 hypothetical protein CA850_30200 [Micromonospora echinospora]
MRTVRSGKPLLVAVAVCAVAHAAGILVADPLWRYAEVLSLALLLAYAVVSGLPQPRWAVPAALTALLVDAVRTMPADPDTGPYGWQILRPGPTDVDIWAGFESGLMLCWASSIVVVVLLAVRHRAGWRRRTVGVAAVAATLVVGYAVVRVVGIWLATRAEQRPYAGGADVADDRVAAVGLAVLPAVALGVTALALATALARHGRWLASAGAVLLALVALPHLDASIGAVPLPLHAGEVRSAAFAWPAYAPSLSMPHPVAALTAAVELTAYLLLVAGLTGARRPTDAAPVEPAGSRP